jgi:hypothetical protein
MAPNYNAPTLAPAPLASLACASIGILLDGPKPLNSLAVCTGFFNLAICKSQGFMLIYEPLAAKCMTLIQLLVSSLVGANQALVTISEGMPTAL